MSTTGTSFAKVAAKRAIPLLAVADLAKQTKRHWDANLSARQRRRLMTLLSQSRGNPGRLSSKQRSEVASLLRELDALALGRRLAVTATGLRKAARKA